MADLDYLAWLLSVSYEPKLDGGGQILAPVFYKLLKDQKVKTIYEWCAGPSWIGLWLLHKGVCEELVVSDINPKAMEHVKKTAKESSYPVRTYVSDNMKDIPSWEKFDIVVANPPNYVNIQTSHSVGRMREDLRPSDIDWKIHKDFYKNIGGYLKENSKMYISEVGINDKEIYLSGEGFYNNTKELYDVRERKPIEDFKQMIKENNLVLDTVIPYTHMINQHWSEGNELSMLKVGLKKQ